MRVRMSVTNAATSVNNCDDLSYLTITDRTDRYSNVHDPAHLRSEEWMAISCSSCASDGFDIADVREGKRVGQEF